MKNLDRPAVRLVDETDERLAEVLPENLAIELADVAAVCREGLLALSVEAGLAAAAAIMAQEADMLCGTWNARDSQRSHRRGGTAASSVVMAVNGCRSGALGFTVLAMMGATLVRCRWSRLVCSPRVIS